MIDLVGADARMTILNSIREHLRASSKYDAIHNEARGTVNDAARSEKTPALTQPDAQSSLISRFKENLEAVNGQCIIAEGQASVVHSLREIITGLRDVRVSGARVALSDAPFLRSLADQLRPDVDQVMVTPGASELFGFDVGITAAQAAIAETGTLILQSDRERHRLISLLPPVHIAIIEATQLCLTLGEALAVLYPADEELSPAITFITGPSRTADIELTLAIGVHGPQQLFVIINTGPQLRYRESTSAKE